MSVRKIYRRVYYFWPIINEKDITLYGIDKYYYHISALQSQERFISQRNENNNSNLMMLIQLCVLNCL